MNRGHLLLCRCRGRLRSQFMICCPHNGLVDNFEQVPQALQILHNLHRTEFRLAVNSVDERDGHLDTSHHDSSPTITLKLSSRIPIPNLREQDADVPQPNNR